MNSTLTNLLEWPSSSSSLWDKTWLLHLILIHLWNHIWLLPTVILLGFWGSKMLPGIGKVVWRYVVNLLYYIVVIFAGLCLLNDPIFNYFPTNSSPSTLSEVSNTFSTTIGYWGALFLIVFLIITGTLSHMGSSIVFWGVFVLQADSSHVSL